MLLACLLLMPVVATAKPEPSEELVEFSVCTHAVWVNDADTASAFVELRLEGAPTFSIPREDLHWMVDPGMGPEERYTTVVSCRLVSSVTSVIDRARNWSQEDWVRRKYRPSANGHFIRPEIVVTIHLHPGIPGDIEYMDLTSRDNPYWDKD